MAEFKSGFVSIIGRTNVGKSTLINSLVGEKVAIMTNKTQTTRTAIRAIVNRENSQIIFIDTPGIHKPKTKLGTTMIETAFGTISEVDVILFMIEATSKEVGRGDARILEKLKETNKKVILLINKISRTRLRNEEDIKEAVQETIVKSYCSLKKLKNSKYFKTWIIKILINECNDIYNKTKKNNFEEYDENTIQTESTNELNTKVDNLDFFILIDSLNYTERIVLTLFYLEEFSTKEIAKILKELQMVQVL